MVKVAFVAAAVAAGVAVASGKVAAATGGEAARMHASLRSVIVAGTTETTAARLSWPSRPWHTRQLRGETYQQQRYQPSSINNNLPTSTRKVGRDTNFATPIFEGPGAISAIEENRLL